MRNGITNLEKLCDFADKESISIADAQTMFGEVGETLYYNLIDQIIGTKGGKPDASEGFRIINSMLATGTDFDVLYAGLLEHFRSIMVGLTCMKAGEFLQVSEEGKRRLKEQLSHCKEHDKLSAVIDIIGKLRHAKWEFELNYPPDIALQKWFLESVFAFRR
jgi:DNA polymerase III gamma/tau subunit